MASSYSHNAASSIFWLDKDIVKSVSQVDSNLPEAISKDIDNAPGRRLHEIINEGWDLFLRVFGDGSVVVSAVLVSFLNVMISSQSSRVSEHRPEATYPAQTIYTSAVASRYISQPTLIPSYPA